MRQRGTGQDHPPSQTASPHQSPLPAPASVAKVVWGCGGSLAPGEVLTISGSSSFAFGVGGLYEGGPSRLWGRR